MAALVPVSGAHSATVLNTTAVNITQSVTDSTDNGTTYVTSTPSNSIALGRFDSSLGVLTGVTVSLNPSSRSETVSITAPTGANTSRTAEGNTTGSSVVTAPGAGMSFNLTSSSNASGGGGNLTDALAVSRSSQGTSSNPGSTNTRTGSVSSTNAAVLNNYVGAGTFNTTLQTPMRVYYNVPYCSSCGGSGTYSVNWTGTLGVQYTYLQHAAPSFDGVDGDPLVLDFQTLTVGDPLASLSFDIYNLAGDRTGLAFTGYSLISGSGLFDIDTNGFTNLAAGSSSSGWSATFDPTAEGSYSATYRLYFADTAGIGASASQINTQYLDVVMSGNVVAAIPEPHEWAMMLAGLGMIGVIARRRRGVQA